MHQIQNPTLRPLLVNPIRLKMTCSDGSAAEADLPAGIVVNAIVITAIAARLTTLRPHRVLIMFMVFPFHLSQEDKSHQIEDTPVHEAKMDNKCRSSLTREASLG